MMARSVKINRVKGQGRATCQDCLNLHPDSTRERCRVHVQQTGHLVRYFVADVTVYRPDSEARP